MSSKTIVADLTMLLTEALSSGVLPVFIARPPPTATGWALSVGAPLHEVMAPRWLPEASAAAAIPEHLPSLGLLEKYGATSPLVWEALDAEEAEAFHGLALELPVWRSQADRSVIVADGTTVKTLLRGDIRVDAHPPDASGEQRVLLFLFSNEQPCAVQLRGGWSLAVGGGAAVLFRDIIEVQLTSIERPPIHLWVVEATLATEIEAEARGALDLAGLFLRHARSNVADPVRAMLSGDDPSPLRLIRRWLAGVPEAAISAEHQALVVAAQTLLGQIHAEANPEDVADWAATRDEIEAVRCVLRLHQEEGAVATLLGAIDRLAREAGCDRVVLPHPPFRLLAAGWDRAPAWWARS